jgi:hypothetical protein
MTHWPSFPLSSTDWKQANTTWPASWSSEGHTWQLVKFTLSDSKVIEEWHRGDEVTGA